MKPLFPELLLIFYLLFAAKHPLVTQVLLCQIKAIHAARQATRQLVVDLDNDTDESWREFLASLWFTFTNGESYAYLGLLAPYLGLFNHPIVEIRQKAARKQFEFSKHALDQSVIDQIQIHDIQEAIVSGNLLEDLSNDKNTTNYLIFESTQIQRRIRIKCSYINRSFIRILAAYEPSYE
ncbi:MAG: DUF4258 domain-containing protein [Leptolyngbyaceae cyanobacterium MO_188.B28]|nr:DUF4258 domain-containing protein [Leptolyngbyaceae cyanobacterium MO_188.B28]